MANASTNGDDSITEVAQSPKRVLEVDLTNSPQPVVTTKLIPKTRPTPVPPLGAFESAAEQEEEESAGNLFCLSLYKIKLSKQVISRMMLKDT